MKVVVKYSVPPQSIEWKGRNYLPGETIPDLEEKEAERLLNLGLVEMVEGVSENNLKELVAAAKMAVDEGKILASGEPDTRAMAEILGRKVSAEDRDRAWAELSKVESED